jgi:hypothetical protein
LPTRAQAKIRTIPGPAIHLIPRRALFLLVSSIESLHHQQTKILLMPYSPKKLGFS